MVQRRNAGGHLIEVWLWVCQDPDCGARKYCDVDQTALREHMQSIDERMHERVSRNCFTAHNHSDREIALTQRHHADDAAVSRSELQARHAVTPCDALLTSKSTFHNPGFFRDWRWLGGRRA